MSDEHLTTEEISALLDQGAERTDDNEHLRDCPRCRREMELLRRMRMALSALDDRKAPRGAWATIEDELEERGVVDHAPDAGAGPGRRLASMVGDLGWLRAAAAVLLFAGGLGLGTVLSPGGAPGPEGESLVASADDPAVAERGAEATDRDGASTTPPAAEAAPPESATSPANGRAARERPGDAEPTADRTDPTAKPVGTEASPLASRSRGAASGPDDLSYRDAMARLEELRARGPSLREAYGNPEAAAKHLARLEALMRASQEALREDPADPALNDFLFRVAEEQAAYNRALHLSSLEYR